MNNSPRTEPRFSLGSTTCSGCKRQLAGKMMKEISVTVAYDAHVFSQLYDEDFLANLVAVSKPRSVVGVVLAPLLLMLQVPRFSPAESYLSFLISLRYFFRNLPSCIDQIKIIYVKRDEDNIFLGYSV